jgi:PEP-CTERM motif
VGFALLMASARAEAVPVLQLDIIGGHYDAPRGPTPTTDWTDVSYYQTFSVRTALSTGFQLHFDLYDMYFRSCAQENSCRPDEDIESFAPFSHSARSGPGGGTSRVPEPSTLAIAGIGLGVASRVRRRTTC